MAFTDKTLFEVTVSNSVRNQTQNVTGMFFSDNAAADCSAGTICTKTVNIPLQGYQNALLPDGTTLSGLIAVNGNSWAMTVAADGEVAGRLPADHTGLYACNTHDVQNIGGYNIGAKTLGLGIPAGKRGNFTELIVGEQYTWGAGNFVADPGDAPTYGFYAVSNGALSGLSAAPTDGSVYFKLVRIKLINEGTSFAGYGYVLECCRNTQ